MSLPQFSIECIEDDDKAILFYTGFPTHSLVNLLQFFGPSATILCYCGKEARFLGRQRSLTSLNEFFLTLCRLCLGMKEQDLAYRFGISQSTVSRIVTTWVNFMFYKFREVLIWPSRQVVDYFMPDNFRSMYPQTRCIVDATEFYIEMPANPTAQQLTFLIIKIGILSKPW